MELERISFGPFTADIRRGALLRDGRPIRIGGKAFMLLTAFLRHPGEVLEKSTLMEAAWPGTAIEESNLTVQIAVLRKLLGPTEGGGEWIATVPRRGYRFTADEVASHGLPEAERDDLRPAVAVLPFELASSDADAQYLADAIADDIIAALTRYRWFRVAARGVSFALGKEEFVDKRRATEIGFRYLVSGSVRRGGSRWRISAQLTDVEKGILLWADRYDLQFEDLFAIQDEIAARVVGSIEPELLDTESRHASARHTGNMTSWELVRRGTWHFHKVTREDHLRSRELFRQARSIDPELAEAHLWLARASTGLIGYGWSDEPDSDSRVGLEAARRAVELDPRNPYAHYALAVTNTFSGRPAEARMAAESAIALAPSFALAHMVLGAALLFGGNAEQAITPLEKGLDLNPHDPQNFVWHNLLAMAHLFAGNAVEARVHCEKALSIRPGWRTTIETLACALMATGDVWEARQRALEASRLQKATSDIYAWMRRLNPHWDTLIGSLLRQAASDVEAS